MPTEQRLQGEGDGALRRTTFAASVAEQVRLQLITGVIQPGERIRVSTLEKRFGVSHIPIREALRQLEAEGLVTTIPQRGAVAAVVDLDDLNGIWDLRRIIECHVARLSAERMTTEAFAEIERRLEALHSSTADLQSQAFRDAHREFHWALLAPGATSWIRRVLDQLWHAADRYIQLFFILNTNADAFMKPHEELAAASKERDPDRLERLLAGHLVDTKGEVRESYLAFRRQSELSSAP